MLARRVIFVDLALAQVAALGATVGFMLGHPAQGLAAYGYSLAFTIGAAALLAGTRAWAGRVPQEALIGVVYVVAAAASILLIDRAPQGAEHLKQILTGNILTSGTDELAVIVPLYAAVGAVHWLLRRRLDGAGSFAWEFVFYATFGVVVTSSVAIAGVLLVFSFLIIPAAIGVIYASSPARQLAIGWTTGTLASAAGLGLSFAFDLPTGATMVCTFGAALAVAGIALPASARRARTRPGDAITYRPLDCRRPPRRLRRATCRSAARRPAAHRCANMPSRRCARSISAAPSGRLRRRRRLCGALPRRRRCAQR